MRRLIEQDKVACLFNTLGTPTNSAIVSYSTPESCRSSSCPRAPTNGATTRSTPGRSAGSPAIVEAQIYAKYILETKPDAKIGILYQNDISVRITSKGVRDIIQAAL